MKEWHCVLFGQPQGPFAEEQLREMARRGEITRDTLVWSAVPEDAARGWVKAAETEVAAVFAEGFGAPRPAAPVAQIPGALFAPFLSPSTPLVVYPQSGGTLEADLPPSVAPDESLHESGRTPEQEFAPTAESLPEPISEAVAEPMAPSEPVWTVEPVSVSVPEPKFLPIVEPISEPVQELPAMPVETPVSAGADTNVPTTAPGDVAAPVEPLRALLLSQLEQMEKDPGPAPEVVAHLEAPTPAQPPPAPAAPADVPSFAVSPATQPAGPQTFLSGTVDAVAMEQAPALAAREFRLAACMINLALSLALVLIFKALPAFLFFGLEVVAAAVGIVTAAMALGFVGANLYFLNRDGQSLGKKAMRVKIVDRDGFWIPLWKIAALRWSVCYVGLIALYFNVWLGAVVFLADACFALRKDQRALHDLIAGTIVVKE